MLVPFWYHFYLFGQAEIKHLHLSFVKEIYRSIFLQIMDKKASIHINSESILDENNKNPYIF